MKEGVDWTLVFVVGISFFVGLLVGHSLFGESSYSVSCLADVAEERIWQVDKLSQGVLDLNHSIKGGIEWYNRYGMVSRFMGDTAYREFFNIFVHNLAFSMHEEYSGMDVGHLFYVEKHIYDLSYKVWWQHEDQRLIKCLLEKAKL